MSQQGLKKKKERGKKYSFIYKLMYRHCTVMEPKISKVLLYICFIGL